MSEHDNLNTLSTGDLLLVQDLIRYLAQFKHRGMGISDARKHRLEALDGRISRMIINRAAAGDVDSQGAAADIIARKPVVREYHHVLRDQRDQKTGEGKG